MLTELLNTFPLPSSNPSAAAANATVSSAFDAFLVDQNFQESFDIEAASAAAAEAIPKNTVADAAAVAATASVRIPAISASAVSAHFPGASGVDLVRSLMAAAN